MKKKLIHTAEMYRYCRRMVSGLRWYVHGLAHSMKVRDEEVDGNGELLKLVPWPPGLPVLSNTNEAAVVEKKLMALNHPIWNVAKRYCDGQFDPALIGKITGDIHYPALVEKAKQGLQGTLKKK